MCALAIQESSHFDIRTLLVRDMRVPSFHPEEPVLFLPEGRQVVNAFIDLILAGMDPPIPYVARAKNNAYWYLGPIALLVAIGQSSRPLTARLLPEGTPVGEMEAIAAKATLLRPIHWLAEARAWRILEQSNLHEVTSGFYRYASTKRRRVTELLRALQTVELLQAPPMHLEHRVISAVGPVIAALDPEFALALLREAERHQWSVRQVIRICRVWEASAVAHWNERAQSGVARLTPEEAARLAAAGMRVDELPHGKPPDTRIILDYPLGSAGLARTLDCEEAHATSVR